MKTYEAIVVGASAGGMKAISLVAGGLPDDFELPIIVVQHLYPNATLDIAGAFSKYRPYATVKEAEDKEMAQSGMMYVAPPGYHLLMERGGWFSLSVETPENFSRPSIDVLFKTAADAYGDKLVAVVLTGASTDGVDGLKAVQEKGGLAIIQDPDTAEVPFLPRAAINAVKAGFVLPLTEIRELFLRLHTERRSERERVV